MNPVFGDVTTPRPPSRPRRDETSEARSSWDSAASSPSIAAITTFVWSRNLPVVAGIHPLAPLFDGTDHFAGGSAAGCVKPYCLYGEARIASAAFSAIM
jgi:hypothetical protein